MFISGVKKCNFSYVLDCAKIGLEKKLLGMSMKYRFIGRIFMKM